LALGEEVLPRVSGTRHSGKRSPSPSTRDKALGKAFSIFLADASVQCYRQVHFFSVCASSLSVALGEDGLPRVSFFPECHGLLSTRGSIPSSSAILHRVQHSGKISFPECPIFGTRGSVWHSGNFASPVVITRMR
jgi:hypothetical protein